MPNYGSGVLKKIDEISLNANENSKTLNGIYSKRYLMLVTIADFKVYIEAYVSHGQKLASLINTDLRQAIFPQYLLQPYKIFGTISTKHGVSIEFVNQASSYEVEVGMVTKPIEEAMLPQKNSQNAAINIGASRNGRIENLSLFSKQFKEKYIESTSGTNIIINPPLDGFVNISSGNITFHNCSFGAEINGKPKYKEIKGFLQISGRNRLEDYSVNNAKINAKEIFNAILATTLHPDFKIGTVESNEQTRRNLNTRIRSFAEMAKKEKVNERKDLQKFFEANPDFLYFGSRYQRIIPQVKLPREGNSDLIPDFLLERVTDGFCDILDIKLPEKRMITGAKDRRAFSHQVDSAIAQVEEYQEYFDEKKNRDFIREKYKANICKPQILVLIGDSTNIDPEELRKIRQRRINEAEVITYSEIIKHMEFLLNYV
jgi:hypothetical protein